jgi:hypothetical protein
MAHNPITASQVLFIKLGEKGEWEKDCIEGQNPCIRLGYRSQQHQKCLAGDWEAIRQYWATTGGKTDGKATEATNQIKVFYTADERTLWITFYQRRLWWCFAGRQVEEWRDESRIRQTLGPWSCKDCFGNDLHIDGLSGALTKVQGFRGTICKVDQAAYLLDRLNGIYPAEVREAQQCLAQLEAAVEKLIPRLGWKDFELLSDLIFTQAGWQRISSLGKVEKTIDMELLSPVTGRRAVVQVKSQADLKTFLEYKQRFEALNDDAEAYFVVHSPTPDLAAHQADDSVFLLTGDRLAKLVISSGLSQWLIQKTS